jgi:Dockerin type I domain
MRGILVIGLILVGMVAQAGQHLVTSLPMTFRSGDHSTDLWDTVTIAGTRLSSAADGLIFTPDYRQPLHHWYINLGSDTLEFGNGNGAGNEGIRVNSLAGYAFHDIIIEGGWIIHKPSNNSDTLINYNTCLVFGSGEGILVKNVNMRANGYNGKCISVSGGYNTEISGGTFYSEVDYYRSRCQFDAVLFNMAASFDSAYAASKGYTFNISIHDVRMISTPHAGMRLSGGSADQYGVFKIYNCSVMVDAHNFQYTSYAGTCASSSNPYAIALSRPGPGTDVHHNVITSGTAYGGGRGILVEHSRGTDDNYVKIHDNNIDIHEGPNAEYDENHMETHALRIRNGCHHVHVYNNTVVATGDANVGTSSYGKSVTPFRYSSGEADGVVNTYSIVEYNTFRARSLGAGVTAYGITFDAVMIADSTLQFRYNRVESDNILVKYGEINDGAKGITLNGDTLKFLSPTYSPQTYHVGHLCNNFDCSRNFARDIVYEGGASDTNIIISCSAQGQMELGIQKTVNIRVVGNNGLPVAGASVQVNNNYQRTVLAGLSSSNGRVSGPATYWWQSRVSDSLLYNLFAIKVKKGTDSTLVSYRATATSLPVVIALAKIAGDSSTCDTCNVICGDINGDELINIMDVGYLLNFLYKNGPPPLSFDAADVNNTGTITQADVTYFISALYKSGPPLICQ